MDENLHNIDGLFRKAIEGHEEMPSPASWESIDRKLDKRKVISISEKYKKLKWAAAALLIFSACLAMYTVHTRLKNKELARLNSVDHKKLNKKDVGTSGNKDVEQDDTATNAANNNDTVANSPLIQQKDTVTTNLPGKIATVDKADKQPIKEDVAGSISVGKSAADVANKNAGPLDRKTGDLPTGDKALVKVQHISTQHKQVGGLGASDNSTATANEKAGKVTSSKEENDVLSNSLKQVDDVATVSQPKDGLYVFSVPDLSFQNALKASENNKMIVEGASGAMATMAKIKGVKTSLLSATVFYSPDFVSPRVDNGMRSFREDDRNEIKNKERIKSASSVGVLLGVNLGRRFSIQSGVTFSSMTTFIQPKFIFARPDARGDINYRFNCFAGYSFVPVHRGNAPAAGDSIGALSSTNTLHYVSVPLTLKYTISKGRFSLSPGLGVAANFLTKGNIETEIATTAGNEKATIDHIEGLNTSYFSGSISLNAEYNLNKTFALSFTPTSRFALSAINNDAPVNTYLNSFGLATGLRIRF